MRKTESTERWTVETVPFTVHWTDSKNQDIWQNLALPPLYYLSIRTGWVFRHLGGQVAEFWRRARRVSPATG